MQVETVEAFLARGGQIQEIPMGLMTKNISCVRWEDNSLPELSNPDKPKPYMVAKKVHAPVGNQREYLEYMARHPGQKPRFVAAALGWARTKVSETRKSCIRAGFMEKGTRKPKGQK